ncbi:hypothetical protein C1H46_024888 [Malus baccata]|uniref:Uncharacterized protein n=1 Tax=Malus baccata TaxID=106549 RepID=A0A540LSR4_MALBA|nr:hypothetical protein C1H46_024888 [Malus baccata]
MLLWLISSGPYLRFESEAGDPICQRLHSRRRHDHVTAPAHPTYVVEADSAAMHPVGDEQLPTRKRNKKVWRICTSLAYNRITPIITCSDSHRLQSTLSASEPELLTNDMAAIICTKCPMIADSWRKLPPEMHVGMVRQTLLAANKGNREAKPYLHHFDSQPLSYWVEEC